MQSSSVHTFTWAVSLWPKDSRGSAARKARDKNFFASIFTVFYAANIENRPPGLQKE